MDEQNRRILKVLYEFAFLRVMYEESLKIVRSMKTTAQTELERIECGMIEDQLKIRYSNLKVDTINKFLQMQQPNNI